MRRCGLDLIESFLNIRGTDPDIEIFKIEHWVSDACDLVVGHHDIPNILVNQVVKAVDVLLHQALDGQKGRNQLPFLLHGLHRLPQLLCGPLVPQFPHFLVSSLHYTTL